VIATSIAGLFTSAVLLSPGLSPSLWQFSVTSSVVLIFSFYLALASRITPLTKERELPIDEITSLFTSIKMDFKGDILNLALDYPQTLNVADFRNLILPLLQSLTRLNYVLSNLALPTLIIKRISYNSPLEISLGGWIPETINALREWAKDKKWRNEHEKNIAVLEIAKTEANLRLTQLEIKGKEIEYAKQLIDLVAPRNISKEQKKILVSRVIPELKLLTSPKVYLTFNDEDNTSVD